MAMSNFAKSASVLSIDPDVSRAFIGPSDLLLYQVCNI